eukprot:1161928-Pelagomonas_calceolata.AAC.6
MSFPNCTIVALKNYLGVTSKSAPQHAGHHGQLCNKPYSLHDRASHEVILNRVQKRLVIPMHALVWTWNV